MRFYLVLASLFLAAGLIFLLQAATPRPKARRPVAQPAFTLELKEATDKAKDLAKAGDLTAAIALLNKARESEPRLAETYLEAGNIYLQAGQPVGAIEEWKKGLEKIGEEPRLLFALGSVILSHQKEPALALTFLKRAEKWDSKLPGLQEKMAEAWATAANYLLTKGDRAGAKDASSKAIALAPDSTLALSVLAEIAEGENRWEDAASHWEKVFSKAQSVENRRSLAQAHKRSGYLQLAKKDRDGAVLHFRRTVDLAAEGVELESILDILSQEAESALKEGVHSFEAGDYLKAKELFSFSASLLPENPIAQNHLGLALLKCEDSEGAVQAWEQALRQAEKVGVSLGDTPTHENLILQYKKMNRTEDARRVGADYLKKYPDGKYAAEIKALVGR